MSYTEILGIIMYPILRPSLKTTNFQGPWLDVNFEPLTSITVSSPSKQ